MTISPIGGEVAVMTTVREWGAVAGDLTLDVTSTPTAVASSISVLRRRNGMNRDLLLDAVRMGLQDIPMGLFWTEI